MPKLLVPDDIFSDMDESVVPKNCIVRGLSKRECKFVATASLVLNKMWQA